MGSTIRMAVAALAATAALAAGAQQAAPYRVTIGNPGDDATVYSDTGEMTVQVAVTPDLAGGDSVELLVDGEPAGLPTTSLDFPLTGMARGQHMLQARIIDATGNVGSMSPPSTFYVWAASLLFPNRHTSAFSHSAVHAGH
jgi:hypothetical protein